MPYSDWQLRRLRHRLEAYRVWRKQKLGVKSWENVAADILNEEEITDFLDQPQDDPIKAFGESLRRFSKDEQTPDEDRLRVIHRFLELKGFLSAIDLKEEAEPHHAAYALNEFLGVPGDASPKMFLQLEGIYHSVEMSSDKITETSLALNLSQGDMVLQATEIRRIYRDPKTLPFGRWSDRDRKAHELSTIECGGWVTVKPGGLFLALLRDARDDEPLCYAALAIAGLEGSHTALTLLRMEQGFAEWWTLPIDVGPSAEQLATEKLKPNLLLFHKEFHRAVVFN